MVLAQQEQRRLIDAVGDPVTGYLVQRTAEVSYR
jgi:Na+/melibiose symporter-like transporter